MYCGSLATVGNKLKVRPGNLLKMDANDLIEATRAYHCGRDAVRIGLEPGDQFSEIVRRQILSTNEPISRSPEQRHWLEIIHRIVLHIGVGCRKSYERPEGAGDKRIAIRGGASSARSADDAAGTRQVFNDQRLAKRNSHALGQDANRYVGRP